MPARAARLREFAADSPIGEAFLDAISSVCAHGHGLELFHARYVCGETFREGARRADGSLDTAGFLGGTADMIRSAARLQGLDEMRAKAREAYKNRKRSTQLMRASKDGDEKRVRELVAAGAKLDLVDEEGESALYAACINGHERIADLLLDGKYEGSGANINLQTVSSLWTPLHIAVINRRAAIVRLLLRRGADTARRAKNGRTALAIARRNNHFAIEDMLATHSDTA